MMQSRYINDQSMEPTLIRNRSTWMINVGTHKKPFNEREWIYLRNSLREAIERVLHDRRFHEKCLYLVRRNPASGRYEKMDLPVFRTTDSLGVDSMVADYQVERGARQGRVDAHILLEVVHSNTRLQFDFKQFAEELNEELEVENMSFAASDITTDDPAKPGQHLQWANGNLFVSFNRLGNSLASTAQAYLLKQTDPQTRDAANLLLGQIRQETNITNARGYRTRAADLMTVLPPPY